MQFVVIEVSDVYDAPKPISVHDSKAEAKAAAWKHFRKCLLAQCDLPETATAKDLRDADVTLPSKKGTVGDNCYADDELFVYFLKVG